MARGERRTPPRTSATQPHLWARHRRLDGGARQRIGAEAGPEHPDVLVEDLVDRPALEVHGAQIVAPVACPWVPAEPPQYIAGLITARCPRATPRIRPPTRFGHGGESMLEA